MRTTNSAASPLLMVIDVQNGFIVPASAAVVPAAVRLIDAWTAAHAPVVLTRYYNHTDSPFTHVLGWHGMTEPPDTDLAAELTPYLGAPEVHVVDKDTYSGLTPAVTDILDSTRATDVFLCGIATDACVLATAIAMFDAGLTPWVVRDACASNASRTPPQRLHNAALMLLDRFIGTSHLIDIEQARSAVTATAARHLGVSGKPG